MPRAGMPNKVSSDCCLVIISCLLSRTTVVFSRVAERSGATSAARTGWVALLISSACSQLQTAYQYIRHLSDLHTTATLRR